MGSAPLPLKLLTSLRMGQEYSRQSAGHPCSKKRLIIFAEEQCNKCLEAIDDGDLPAASRAAKKAGEAFIQSKDWLRAAVVHKERLRLQLQLVSERIEGTSKDIEELEKILFTAVELFYKTGNFDIGLQMFMETAGFLWHRDNRKAKKLIELAIHTAELKGRPKQAEMYKKQLSKRQGNIKVKNEDKILGPKFQHIELNGKEMMKLLEDSGKNANKVETDSKKGEGLTPGQALGTLVPLGAAVYSGAVGLAACKPSFIGLTPSQFREVKKHDWDHMETHEDLQLMDEGTSLV